MHCGTCSARVEDKLPRTNNDIEGWHSGFDVMFRHTHPPVWQFIDVLKQDSSFNRMKIAQVIAGAAPRPQTRIYREITLRIRNLIAANDINNIIPFLRGISYNLKT